MGGDTINLHFLANKLQPTIYRRLSLDLILLEQGGSDELVDVLAFLELLKLALHTGVLGLLCLELLAGGDDRLQFLEWSVGWQ